MTIPAPPRPPSGNPLAPADWAGLSHGAKRERLLLSAGEVFARDGLDASMPSVATAAGAGVASVYRQFASKRELVAALVASRLDQIGQAAIAAGQREGDAWSALVEMLRTLVQRQSCDDLLGEARAAVADHPSVVQATDRATASLEALLSAARAEGKLRADATTLDLKLLFAATRAARQVEPAAWPRMLDLLIDSLRATTALQAAGQ